MGPLLLATVLAMQSPLAVQTLDLDGGPDVRIHRDASPLVALRLSAPVPPGLPEGAVELLEELARPDAVAAAHRFGARVELRHDDGRAVVAVTGPAAAFDAMVAILRRATGPPDLSVTSLRRARARAEDRVLARLEQPAPRIRLLLRRGLHGGPLPRGPAISALTLEAIRDLRARLYDSRRVRVVLVGAVPDAVVRSAFAGWPGGAAREGAVPASTDTTVTPARPQVHREWGGIAFGIDADPAVLAVAAELVQRRVERSALRYGTVETWDGPTPALALIGAAAPGDSVVRASAGISDLAVRDSLAVPAGDVRRYLRRLVAEAAALAGRDAVAAARAAVRRRLLLEARTASGKAEVIGRALDRLGADLDPGAYLRRLDGVRLGDIRALLGSVLATPAVVAGAG